MSNCIETEEAEEKMNKVRLATRKKGKKKKNKGWRGHHVVAYYVLHNSTMELHKNFYIYNEGIYKYVFIYTDK